MPDLPQPKFRREFLGAYVIAVFAIPGALFSLFLTILKFRNEFTCERVLLTTCAQGCDVALRDSWSTVLGVPLTLYGTAFFLVALGVASCILLSGRLAPFMRQPTLLLGWAGLLTSLALFLYAWLGLGEICSLCAVLYCACIGVFLGAWLVNPEGPVAGFRDRSRGTWLEAGMLVVVVSTAFAALTGVQYNRYRAAVLESRKASLLTCLERRSLALPPTSHERSASQEPDVVLGLFIDLTCPHCRNEYDQWIEYWKAHRESIDLRVFHFPMDPQCRGGNSPGSTRNSACIGALALECMLRTAPEHPENIVRDMFALQDSGEPFFDMPKIEVVAARHGVADIAGCVAEDSAVDLRVRHHVLFARAAGLREAPALVIAAVRRGKIIGSIFPIIGSKDPSLIEEMIREAQARARSDDNE